jgi:2-keto-3-deoxy-L-rhamnonate aldolase RhmA
MLPFPIRFAVQTDLALNAIAAVVGPDHVMLGPSQIAQFAILVAAGIVLHEAATTATRQ